MTTLKEQREQAGWTQSDVADHTGVDIRTVRRWEAANVPPRRVSLTYDSLFPSLGDDADVHDESSMETPGPVSISDVIQQQPDRLQITGPLSRILGHLPRDHPFSILLGGASGGGKSTLALRLASTFAEHGSVLYCTSEERIDSGTIGIRAKQLGIDEDDIDVIEIASLDQIEDQLSGGPYGYCIIDSVNELDIGPEDVIALMNDHRDVSWVLVAQANSTEKATVGGARWRHLVDIRLWCEVDKDGNRIVRNLKNRFAPEASQITMSAAAQTGGSQAKRAKQRRQTHEPTTKEDNMPDYNDWIIRRLEGDLDIARKEADVLRAKLDAREERVRELELKLNRFEVERELESEEPDQSLSDKFDPESIGKMADKLAPFAMVLGDIMRTIKPAIAPQPAMPPPIPNVYQSPFGASTPIPDDSHLLFPDLGAKQ